MTAAPRPATRAVARLQAVVLGILTGATGMLPPRIRYGYVHRISRVLLHKPLPAVLGHHTGTAPAAVAQVTRTGDVRCVLAVGALDIGGIGSVVELLATGLPAMGVTTAVVCHGDGARAERIRDRGIDVRSVPDRASARQALDELRPDVVQLHGAPDFIAAAALESGAPLVPVLHNTEIHFSRVQWHRLAKVMGRSSAAVAVSDVVRTFHAVRLPAALEPNITVIPNAVPGRRAPDPKRRRAARDHLEGAVGHPFHQDVLFVCLARYDAQKNIAGTVASFLRCAARGAPAQLIIAGEPSDWVEFTRSDAIRRSSRYADRVHLLATSDAQTLLAAADAFVLNSFFEGWPVAATEAWTAGLPLILSDVGGARELVARDAVRSVLITNESGDASVVTDSRVERARFRAGHQRNSSEFGDAIRRVVDTVQRERVLPPAPNEAPDDVPTMIASHARVLRDTADSENFSSSPRPGRFSIDEVRGTVTS